MRFNTTNSQFKEQVSQFSVKVGATRDIPIGQDREEFVYGIDHEMTEEAISKRFGLKRSSASASYRILDVLPQVSALIIYHLETIESCSRIVSKAASPRLKES